MESREPAIDGTFVSAVFMIVLHTEDSQPAPSLSRSLQGGRLRPLFGLVTLRYHCICRCTVQSANSVMHRQAARCCSGWLSVAGDQIRPPDASCRPYCKELGELIWLLGGAMLPTFRAEMGSYFAGNGYNHPSLIC